jgi:predicted protein tyrosine phosphatase
VAPAHPWAHDEFVHGYWVEPGRILAGEYPGHLDESRAARKLDLLLDHGIRIFVDLTHPVDGMAPYEPLLAQAAEARGLDLRRIHHPIPDMGVLDHTDYDAVVTTVREATTMGGVYVHCWGGIGRTATVVGCLLVDAGLGPHEALARIDELRSVTQKRATAAPQTRAQVDVILQRRGAP